MPVPVPAPTPAALLLLALTACAPDTFHSRRAAHPTDLHTRAPSPGRYTDTTPPRAERILYAGALWAWYACPATPPPHAAVVYFHGGFSLTPDDFEHALRFVDAGHCVLAPTLRGENGNPGHLELLWGELDDAVAAIRWVAARREIDPDRVYAIGHSVGGALAALVSLRPDAPVRRTASVGGIYVPETFARWSRMRKNRHLVRFDPHDRDEAELRTLLPNVRHMVHPHHAWVGRDDPWFHANVDATAAAAAAVGAPFFAARVPGDHETSLPPGIAAFLAVIASDDGDP